MVVLGVSSPDEPKAVKISPEPASSPSFFLMKLVKFELELEPEAYLLGAKNSSRAFEPELMNQRNSFLKL